MCHNFKRVTQAADTSPAWLYDVGPITLNYTIDDVCAHIRAAKAVGAAVLRLELTGKFARPILHLLHEDVCKRGYKARLITEYTGVCRALAIPIDDHSIDGLNAIYKLRVAGGLAPWHL